MAEPDENDKRFATRILEAYDYQVGRVPVGDGSTADLLATNGGETLVVEIKRKEDAPEETATLDAQLKAGEVAYRATELTKRGRIRSLFADAEKQLTSTAQNESDFRLVWLRVSGRDAEVYWKQAHNAFFGVVDLIDMDSPAESPFVECWYFDYSAAWQLPNIDAMAITDGRTFGLWLNEFSPRYAAIQETQLWSQMLSQGGGLDPPRRIDSQGVIAFRSEVSRSDEKAVEAALQAETGIRYEVCRPTSHVAEAAVQRPPKRRKQTGD